MCHDEREHLQANAGFRSPFTAANWPVLCAESEPGKKWRGARSDDFRLGLQRELFEREKPPFARWSHELFGRESRRSLKRAPLERSEIDLPDVSQVEKAKIVQKLKCSWLLVRSSCKASSGKLLCQSRCVIYKVCRKLTRKDRSPVFWQKTELQLSLEWRWPDAYISDNHEYGSSDSAVVLFVLAAKLGV